jgi:Sulfotransferase domain.
MQEAGWFGTWYEQEIGVTPEGFATLDLIPNLLRTCKNIDLGMSAEDLEQMIGNGKPVLYRDFVSALFDRYGAARGKFLAGSKNPDYLRHLPTLHELWPQAKFVHIIRDGRDVCLCAGDRWKGKPGPARFPFMLYESPDRIFDDWQEDPVTTTALWWEWNVRLGRDFGRCLGPAMYYEMRYEALVTQPREECLALCEFLGLPFDEAMLRHEENFKPRKGPNGTILHARVGLPITRGLRNWRTDMTPEELGRFEAAAGPFLDELGYSRAIEQPQTDDLAQAAEIRSLFEEVASSAGRIPLALKK